MYDYITLTQTNIDGSISPFPNGASGLILLGTGISTPPQWTSLADAGIATKQYVDNTFLPLAGGTLTGALTGTSASFSGGVTATGGFTGDLTGNASTATEADHVSGRLKFESMSATGNVTTTYWDGSGEKTIFQQIFPDGILYGTGSSQSASAISWPDTSNAAYHLLLCHTGAGALSKSWVKLADATNADVGILGWTYANNTHSFELIKAANNGEVLTKTANGYVFAPIGSAIIPAITGLQSGTNSTTSKILLGGADASSSPTWVSLTDVPTGLSAGVAKIDSNGKLTSGTVSLAGSEVTETLPVSKGGTGLSTLGSANQVLTSNGSTMVWANKANAAVTADQVANHLGFTVKNGNTVSTLYYDGSAAVDGANLLPIQKTHAAGILKGNGTAWTSSVEPSTIAGVTKQVLVAIDQGETWGYEFEPLSSVLPAITGLASGSTNEGYILSVGASPGYTPTWIPRTDLNIPSAPSSLPLVDNETGALGTSGTYANADHQHPLPYAVQAAYKFFYPRKIGIGGAVTAEAQEYDGTADLILQVTEIDPHAIINTVPIEKGGTGATTATAALINLGAAASNHNHDSTYLKLSGGNMTGTINTPDNVTPLYWVGKSGVATFVSGDLTVQDNVNAFVTGRRLNINLYEATISANVNSPTEITHVAKQDTTVNIVCGVGATSAYTKYINLPTPTSDMLGDTITVYFTNQAPAVTGSIFAKCSTDNRIKAFDYSNFSNTPGNIGFKNCVWSSGNVVQFTCINLENNGTTYYWRAVKLVEQSW